MFNRSRNKIIVSIMGSLILLFAVTITVIMAASFHDVRQRNMNMLERYVETYTLEHDSDRPVPGPAPDDHGRPIDERPDYQLSTFYSVAFAKDGSILAIDNSGRDIYSEEDLVSLARGLLTKTKGEKDKLMYIVDHRSEYTLVAFLDNTVAEGSLNTLVRYVFIVGGVALVLLFFISLGLSKRIIRPLEENDRKQKRFISDASHELKTPVSVISANAEMLSRELGNNEWLSNIQYENDRMGELVKQLLDLSRAENSDTPMEPVDFSRVATGEALAFESLAFEKGKILECDVEDDLFVMGNKNQLTQLVSILLDNAVRHSDGEKIEVTLKHQGHTAVLSTINDGEEIPLEKQEHLFDRFYRIDEARNSEDQHYGLGLSIAKAVSEKHGGNIAVSCAEGKIRFTVILPLKK
ncbi:MAG: HAMP domain-containing histidine kinase [Dehalococcoidales bacterium]|nr:HAMP domain-containing histidine kinase [Dehalococcoidales bacterium]